MKGVSLKYKFMAALLLIPLVGLTLFLLLAKSIFEKDKVAYVFDSSLSVTKTRAARVSSELTSVISLAQAIVLSYRADTKNLSETGTYFFDREDRLDVFQLYAWNGESSNYEKTVDLTKPSGKALLSDKDALVKKSLIDAKSKAVLVRGLDAGSERLLMVARFGEVSDPKHVIAVIAFGASDLAQIFLESGAYSSFLARRDDGQLIFISKGAGVDWEAVWTTLSGKTTPEGIEEIGMPSSSSKFLTSYSDVGVGNLIVVSTVDKRAALSAGQLLLKKSSMFFIALIALTAIFSVITSGGMTVPLTKLSQATQKVAQGDFDVRVDIDAGGEIGALSTSFNTMASEISRLMKETAEKARMETELATAKTVQETLFPEPHADFGEVEISGHYTPASECGGDWWYYCENADFIYIWVGDATGHGAPAALLTSAARAVASIIAIGPPMAAGDCMSILNRAICDTSKGRMMMTFFLASIEKSTGLLTYSNASHEPPLVLRRRDEPAKRDDFVPLNNINNPRLGENPDHAYQETSHQLSPGDTVVFYTDGVVDVKNYEGKTYGERRFMKALGAALVGDSTSTGTVEQVVGSVFEFREGVPLDDDVTLVICRYHGKGRAKQSQGAA